MQVSNPKSSQLLYKLQLCLILMLAGNIHTHALTMDNVDAKIITAPTSHDSYSTENLDLFFEDVAIKKNDLNINSDGASITDLKSGKTIFTFSGNVEIVSKIVLIKCDKAILEFEENELKNARFIGKLSSFQQFDDEREIIASGTAEVFEYDHKKNILRMETNAWVDNGSNEVSGNLITYNLVKKNIIADAENGLPVKLIINSSTIN